MGTKAIKTTAAILCLAALALAGCGSSSSSGTADSGSGGSSSGSSSGGSSGGSGGDCGGFKTGEDGVIRAFCDGNGSAKVTVGGNDYTIDHVSCATSGGQLTVNGGVVIGTDFKGTKPDYVGLVIPEKGGDFSNATVAVTVGGEGYALTENSGTGDATSGTFTGKAYGSDTEISGSYTC